MERLEGGPSSAKRRKIEGIVKEHVKELEESLVGVLNETLGAGLTPRNSSAALSSSALDLSEDDFVTLKKAKNLSKLSTSKPAVKKSKPKSKSILIGICKMERSRKGGIKKAGDYYEVPLSGDDSYSQCVNKALNTLSWDYDTSEGYPCLCRLNGCRIIDDDLNIGGRRLPWTVSNYINAIGLKSHQVKLGIALFENPSSSEEEGYQRTKTGRRTTKKDPSVKILYAAKIGSCGIDTHSLRSREELWLEKHGTLSLINTPIPWYPELGGYGVCNITVGGVTLLSYVDGGFVVKDDNKESFSVVHQSPCEHTIATGEAVPLFCIASQHSFSFKYTWDNLHGEFGAQSPVIFTTKSGVYRCTIENDGQKCYSKSIFITERDKEDSPAHDSDCVVVLPEDTSGATSGRKSLKTRSGALSAPVSESARSMATVTSEGRSRLVSRSHTSPSPNPIHSGYSKGLRVFNYSELLVATSDFMNLIGRGGFGKVYKGDYHGTELAVKVLNEAVDAITESPKGTLRTEIDNLTRFRHPNLIELMGYCESPACLVYPYMSNLSLFHCLHEYKVENPLSWENRVSILSGTAKGLAYLHSSEPPFLHQDVKSHNILLDESLHPRVADFGFATPLPSNFGSTKLLTVCGSVGLAGTRGYVAPEFNDGRRGVKTDVYMYGIVVLETFTGLLAFSEQREEENLLDHCKEEGLLEDISLFVSNRDSKVKVPAENTSKAFFEVISLSTKHNHKKRCSMDTIIEIWKRAPQVPSE